MPQTMSPLAPPRIAPAVLREWCANLEQRWRMTDAFHELADALAGWQEPPAEVRP